MNGSLFEEGELEAAPDNISRAAFEAWNEAAEKHGWAVAKFLTAGRPAALRRTIKSVGGIHAWRALLERCSLSDFLCGRTTGRDRRPFTFTLDWVCKPANLLKVMEGNYFAEERANARVPLAQQMQPTDRWALFMRDYKLRGFWPPDLGFRPEDPRCQAPAAMLEACRKRLGITVVTTPVEETREQRLASLIVSYRTAGRHEDANRIERELAILENRPPVEVPAPDARSPDIVPQGPRRPPPPPISRADAERARRMAHHASAEPPAWTDIPEGDIEMIGDEGDPAP